jgi:hypothetical protein
MTLEQKRAMLIGFALALMLEAEINQESFGIFQRMCNAWDIKQANVAQEMKAFEIDIAAALRRPPNEELN